MIEPAHSSMRSEPKRDNRSLEIEGSATDLAVDAQFRLARVWQHRGRLEQAIKIYKEIVSLRSDYVPAHVHLGHIMAEQGRLSEALGIYRRALEMNPDESALHKGLVYVWVKRGELEEAFKYYQLERKDTKRIEICPEDVLCCTVVRNESIRLPQFLSYYREKGVSKFLMVDNGSSDNTLSYLLEQPDVYTWQSSRSFMHSNYGAGWFELLLREYGIDHWCLIVDADEILYYANCEERTIVQLCRELDRKRKRAFTAVLLDMYSDKAIGDTHYTSGQAFLEVCPYFDRAFYHTKHEQGGPHRNQTWFLGGMRQRVFGQDGAYLLSKVPLIKYNPDLILAGGQHWTNYPTEEIASETGCLLHFKYFSTFIDYARQEAARKEHYGNAMQYREYALALSQNEALTFYDANHSICLQGSRQLVEMGIIRNASELGTPKLPSLDGRGWGRVEASDVQHPHPTSPVEGEESNSPALGIIRAGNNPEGLVCDGDAIETSRIELVENDIGRPFWSVMITAYDRTNYLERALRSVVDQATGPEDMQIEVVNDGAPDLIQTEIKAIVDAVGQGRVSFCGNSENVGHPHIFNRCIEKARGHWIHILHDDDWLNPGFYSSLRKGIEQEPEIGAAFCRHIRPDEEGCERWISWLERETPGVIEEWLERIAVMCRLQFASIVVRRKVYESLGGFCPQAGSAFDWEMWKRIAIHYSFWYEPRPLACFCQGSSSETQRLLESGKQIADALRCIEISRRYLPPDLADRLSRQAKESYAGYALDVARQQLNSGNYHAAIANMRGAIECSRSEHVKRELVSLLLHSRGFRGGK
jgi:glycosyltransferase involved in cell wall biosynthesis/tetratricopeptide (TPR) repeat protein